VFGYVSSQFYATWEQNQAGADFFRFVLGSEVDR